MYEEIRLLFVVDKRSLSPIVSKIKFHAILVLVYHTEWLLIIFTADSGVMTQGAVVGVERNNILSCSVSIWQLDT